MLPATRSVWGALGSTDPVPGCTKPDNHPRLAPPAAYGGGRTTSRTPHPAAGGRARGRAAKQGAACTLYEDAHLKSVFSFGGILEALEGGWYLVWYESFPDEGDQYLQRSDLLAAGMTPAGVAHHLDRMERAAGPEHTRHNAKRKAGGKARAGRRPERAPPPTDEQHAASDLRRRIMCSVAAGVAAGYAGQTSLTKLVSCGLRERDIHPTCRQAFLAAFAPGSPPPLHAVPPRR